MIVRHGMRATFSIDPRILAAADIVARRRGVERKALLRSMSTPDVLEEFAALVERGAVSDAELEAGDLRGFDARDVASTLTPRAPTND